MTTIKHFPIGLIKPNTNGNTHSLSYCRHTNTKLAISSTFFSSKTARKKNVVASENPIFAMALPDIYAIYNESKTPTEKYVAMTAYLVQFGIIDTSRFGLYLDTNQYFMVEPIFKEFIMSTITYCHDKEAKAKLNLVKLRISADNCDSGTILKEHIRTNLEAIATTHTNYYAHLMHELAKNKATKESEIESLYTSAEEERDLLALLNSRKSKAKVYGKKISEWAIRQLTCKGELTKEQLKVVRYYLFSPSEHLLADTLKDVISLVKEHLTYEDHERESSLMTIRLLSDKLEEIGVVEQDYGFIITSAEEVKVPKAIAQYQAKTGREEKFRMPVQKTTNTPFGTSALERLKNKWKKVEAE